MINSESLDNVEIGILQKKVVHLERCISVIIIIVIVSAVIGWNVRDHIISVDTVITNKIETNQLDIRDTSGTIRCRVALNPTQDFISMKLFGSDTNTMRLSLGVSASSGTTGIALYNKSGKKIMFLTNEADTSSSINIYNKDGTIASSIVNNGQNNVIFSGNYVVTDRSGSTRAIMGLSDGADGYPYIDLYDKEGIKRLGLYVDEKSTYGLALFDSKGLNRATFGITQQNSGATAIIDGAGKIVWKAP